MSSDLQSRLDYIESMLKRSLKTDDSAIDLVRTHEHVETLNWAVGYLLAVLREHLRSGER